MPDARVQQQLTRGARIRAILNQVQHAPLRLADEVALVTAVQAGLLDAMPPETIPAFRAGLADALDRGAPDISRQLQEGKSLDPAGREALLTTLRQLVDGLSPSKSAA